MLQELRVSGLVDLFGIGFFMRVGVSDIMPSFWLQKKNSVASERLFTWRSGYIWMQRLRFWHSAACRISA